jgi:hypothetical protein
MKRTIIVTAEDLATSNYTDISECALAKALKREFPDSEIAVGGLEFVIDGILYPLIYPTPFQILDRCGLENQEPVEVTFYLKD